MLYFSFFFVSLLFFLEKIQKRYGVLNGEVIRVDLDRSSPSLTPIGLSLAGHKNRTIMAVFICGLNPNGSYPFSALISSLTTGVYYLACVCVRTK